MSLLQLLREGRIEEFNGRRGARVTLDFFAADLANLPLAGVDFSGANLEKADLSGADLTGAILAKATLTGADLTGANLSRCIAVKARLREAYLGDARADGGEFSGADFTEADLTKFRAEGARFGGARFKGAILTSASLPGCDFTEAKMGDVDLRDSDVPRANFASAEMPRANLAGARLQGSSFKGARLGGAVFRGANLDAAVFGEADLSGADLGGASTQGTDFNGADLFDAQIDPEALSSVRKAPPPPPAEVVDADALAELGFDDPSVAVSGSHCAVLWENADAEEVFSLRTAVFNLSGRDRPLAPALRLPADQVLARAVLPTGDAFACAVLLDRPGGVELTVVPLSRAGAPGEPASLRLGYIPVVKPIFVPDDDGFVIYGIGRQGALSIHRYAAGVLTELMRAPAGTYRGFCGRSDPILLGKGGTVAAVRRDGIGRLITAPSGYPGRVTAAAYRAEGAEMALAWSQREERGVRVQILEAEDAVRGDVLRFDPKAEIAAVDVLSVGERWLLVWVIDGVVASPQAVWLPAGKPFPLFSGKATDEYTDVRLLPGRAGAPLAALITADEELRLVEIAEDKGTVLGKLP